MKTQIINKTKTLKVTLFAVLHVLAIVGTLNGQSSIEFSTYMGGNNGSNTNNNTSVIHDGYIYTIARTRSTDINTTDGSNASGNFDIWFLKQDTNGKIIHSKLIGGSGADFVEELRFHNNALYLYGQSQSVNFPTTDGSVYNSTDGILVMKLDTAGKTQYARIITGSGNDEATGMDVENGELYLAGVTASNNFPVTDGSSLSGFADQFALKLDTNGNITYAIYIGGSNSEYKSLYRNQRINQVIAKNGILYFVGATSSSDFPITTGQATSGTGATVVKLNVDGSISYATKLGGSHITMPRGIELIHGEVYILNFTFAFDYPVTDGIPNPNPLSTMYALTKLSTNGNILHSRFYSSTNLNAQDLGVFNNELYFLGVHRSGFPTTNGSVNKGSLDVLILKFDTTLNITFSSFYGGSGIENVIKLRLVPNGIFVLGVTNSIDYPVTNGSSRRTTPSSSINFQTFIMKLNSMGNIVFSSYLNSHSLQATSNILTTNNSIFFQGFAQGSDHFVTTHPTSSLGNLAPAIRNITFTQFNLCPDKYEIGADTLTPSRQMVCVNGFVNKIVGTKIVIPSDSMATLYHQGIGESQNEQEANYQWQISSSATGPWQDIPAAVQKDYTPKPTISNTYYRRLARKGVCCNNEIISTSNVDTIEISLFTAPIADAGSIYNTCSSGPGITLGATPSPASGGLAPYSYSWSQLPSPDSALANPSAAPTKSTVYTLTVIDANGCKQVDQALVNVFEADAGPDVPSCAGDSVRLIGVPLPGVSGVSYSWSPSTGISEPNIVQPNALPGISTDYILTMNFPKTGGGTCSVTDTTRVNIVSPPTTPNFAGADQTICFSQQATLGAAPEAGFSYTWAPGNFLTSNSSSSTTYDPGTLIFPPNPDPAVYTVTAARQGCFYADAVRIEVINADAGLDGCGPRILGVPEKTDVFTLNETFQWKKISGGGRMLADSNASIVPVSASPTNQPSTYVLLTTLNGVTCTDTVLVPDCVCNVEIIPTSNSGCPNTKLGPVSLTAHPAIGEAPNYTYSWTPTIGLSAYNAQTVEVLDTAERTYTVTITSLIDPNFICSDSITVNKPGMTVPNFQARDTVICPGQSVNVGRTPVVGYGYKWTPSVGLSPSDTVSNPAASPSMSIDYVVRVTDIGTGCFTLDTASVTVREPIADAGPDWVICSASTIRPGTPALPHHTYSWSPGSVPFQNGTDSTFAIPEVLIATDLSLFLMTTDTLTGCIAHDTVSIVVNSTPTLVSAPDVDVCLGSSKTIGSPALPGVTYSWFSFSGTGALADPSMAQTTVTPNQGTAITYFLTATFPGGCNASDLITVRAHDPSFTLTDLSYCPSGGAVALGTTAPAGMSSYQWSPSALVTNADIANPSTQTPPPPQTTTYRLTVRDAFGCSATDGITLTPSISTPDAGSNRILCLNQATTLGNVNNTTGGNISYAWSPATGLNDTTSRSPIFTPPGIGTFKFALNKTDASISCTSSDTVLITVVDYSLPIMSAQTICRNTSTAIGVANTPGARYFWTPSASLSDPQVSMPIATPSTTTTYSLTSIGLNGCIATTTTTVGVNTDLSPTITLEDTFACLGDAAVTFEPLVSPTGGVNYNYLWSPNDGSISNIYALNPTITPGNTGVKNYTLSVTDTTGCSTSKTAALTVLICPALPVEFLSVTATPAGSAVFINWKTANEYNNAHFVVERLDYSGGWIPIGTVKSVGNGNSVATNTYSLIDFSPQSGKNYYRIKQVDNNGTFHFSEIRMAYLAGITSGIRMYPNPADKTVTLQSTNEGEPIEFIRLYASDGQAYSLPVIRANELKQTLNTTSLAQGTYYLQVKTNTGQLSNFKLVIVR